MIATDLTGGLLALAGVFITAILGWFATRGSANSRLATDLLKELRQDNVELRERLDELEAENAELRNHVDKCDTANDRLKARIETLEFVVKHRIAEEHVHKLMEDDDPTS